MLDSARAQSEIDDGSKSRGANEHENQYENQHENQYQNKSEVAAGWSFSGTVRIRTEYLANSFRIVAPKHDHQQFSRADLALAYTTPSWRFDLEIQDSRAWGAKPLSPLGTDDVNALEPIQLKVSKSWQSDEGGALTLGVGRMTLDYGSRRLLARNNYRNTSNAFQGLQATQTGPDSTTAAFYTFPLQRRPDGLNPAAQRDNRFAWDKAGSNERFWGISHDYTGASPKTTLAAYVFGLELRDAYRRLAADRDIITLGTRLTWQGAAMDAEIEGAYQWGKSAAEVLSAPPPRLDHRAWFTHVHVGVDVSPGLNLRFSYDQATGDRDPFDGKNERFDRLYGARAFELGPSGIFGAAVRSNLRSPGLRVRWESTSHQTWLLSHRWLALDSPRDFFVTGGRRDASGDSGRNLGRQWELRWRWKSPAETLTVDVGGAYLDKGRYFAGSSSALLNPSGRQDSEYLFTQLTWRY